MATVLILGAGMMGTAMAWPLSDRGHQVRLVGTHLDGEIVTSIAATGTHPKLGLTVPARVTAYPVEALADALHGVDAVLLGVSSAGVPWAAERLGPLLEPEQPVAMISKGLHFDGSTLQVLPDVFTQALPEARRTKLHPVAVAGPCIAGELARRVPTCVVFTGRSAHATQAWSELAEGSYYHVWQSQDVIGVEVCAALKNAYAMGVALPSGVHAAAGGENGSIALHNYESAVFAQSLWEMKKLIAFLGGSPEEAGWLPGAGDLDVTCNGGRTGRFGHLLGLGLSLEQARARMQGATLECLEILAALKQALSSETRPGRLGLKDLPLAAHLIEIALDGAPVNMPFKAFFD